MHAAARQRLADLAARAIPVACDPTPVDELTRLGDALGLRHVSDRSGRNRTNGDGLRPEHVPRLLVKRDDALPFAMGGNKVRKMRLLARRAIDEGADTLVTMGGVQSNHARVTAAVAAACGLRSLLVLNGAAPDPPTGNALLQRLFGAEIVMVSGREDREPAMRDAADRLTRQGRRPYVVPLGGSSPEGALAYAHAFGELLRQIDPPDVIIHSTSSGGTQAGLAAGAALCEAPTRIVGISADDPSESIGATVRALIPAIGRLTGVDNLSHEGVEVDDRFVGGGYGVTTEASTEAIQLAARTEAMLLDPVYTAKAMAGLIARVRAGTYRSDHTILFWHTGGLPALFA